MVPKKIGAYDLAREFGVAHTTIYNWIDRGLPYSEVEQGTKKVKRFDTDEVKEWIKENSK